jgi:hypothetical protein
MLDEIVLAWSLYQKILREGKEIGMAKGEIFGLRHVILTIIQRRFPLLSDEAEVHPMGIADLEQLHTIAKQIAFVPDEVAARVLLGLPA